MPDLPEWTAAGGPAFLGRSQTFTQPQTIQAGSSPGLIVKAPDTGGLIVADPFQVQDSNGLALVGAKDQDSTSSGAAPCVKLYGSRVTWGICIDYAVAPLDSSFTITKFYNDNTERDTVFIYDPATNQAGSGSDTINSVPKVCINGPRGVTTPVASLTSYGALAAPGDYPELDLAPHNDQAGAVMRIMPFSNAGFEANPRWSADLNGAQSWGAGGASATDVNLARSAANALQITSSNNQPILSIGTSDIGNLNIRPTGSDAVMVMKTSANGAALTTRVSNSSLAVSLLTNATSLAFGTNATARITIASTGDITTANVKHGFFGAAAASQPTAGGVTAGFTVGAGTAMNSASTSTGNIGASAYTFGDIVAALKTLGLVAA